MPWCLAHPVEGKRREEEGQGEGGGGGVMWGEVGSYYNARCGQHDAPIMLGVNAPKHGAKEGFSGDVCC